MHQSQKWEPFFGQMLAAIRQNLSHPLAAFPPSVVASTFATQIPYRFLPVRDVLGAPHVWTLWDVQRRGFAACSEAAAAIAASAVLRGAAPNLCVKASASGAHVTTTVDGAELDPYGAQWTAGHNVCDGFTKVDPAWFASAR